MWTIVSGSSHNPPGTGQTYALKIKDSVLRNLKINSPHTKINTSLLSNGLYMYSLVYFKKTIKSGALIVD